MRCPLSPRPHHCAFRGSPLPRLPPAQRLPPHRSQRHRWLGQARVAVCPRASPEHQTLRLPDRAARPVTPPGAITIVKTRQTRPRPGRPRPARTVAGLLALAAVAVPLVAACGSTSSTGAASASLLGTAKQQQCTSVADVLSDGPDPGADPVGYAQAQVLPLRQLKITDPSLSKAVKTLASAYQAYATSTGAAKASAAPRVSRAENAVNAICPGAAN